MVLINKSFVENNDKQKSKGVWESWAKVVNIESIEITTLIVKISKVARRRLEMAEYHEKYFLKSENLRCVYTSLSPKVDQLIALLKSQIKVENLKEDLKNLQQKSFLEFYRILEEDQLEQSLLPFYAKIKKAYHKHCKSLEALSDTFDIHDENDKSRKRKQSNNHEHESIFAVETSADSTFATIDFDAKGTKEDGIDFYQEFDEEFSESN